MVVDTFVDMYTTLRDMRKRQLAHQFLNLAMIVCSALMIWKSLMVITSSESPVVVVLSGSMEPAFHRGDILFLHMGFTPFRAGDIVVFKVADRDIPIVHRVLKVHEKEDGEVDLLTKGDNNAVDDRGLYAAGQSWINKEHVIGRAKGYLPYVRGKPVPSPSPSPSHSRTRSGCLSRSRSPAPSSSSAPSPLPSSTAHLHVCVAPLFSLKTSCCVPCLASDVGR